MGTLTRVADEKREGGGIPLALPHARALRAVAQGALRRIGAVGGGGGECEDRNGRPQI